MLNANLPEDLRDMPRGLLMHHLGIDPSEPLHTSGDYQTALAELQAQVERERAS